MTPVNKKDRNRTPEEGDVEESNTKVMDDNNDDDDTDDANRLRSCDSGSAPTAPGDTTIAIEKKKSGGGGGGAGTVIDVKPRSSSDIIDNDDDVDNEEDDLERKVETIDRKEAAAAPTLQRNMGFTSTPGAFRASPIRGLRRAGADGARTSLTSMGDTSTVVSRGGGGRATLPPIEAILVDGNNSFFDDDDDDPQRRRRQQQRRRRRDDNRRNGGGGTNDDDDSMDVFTAEPLASVKEFVATTPRCIILFLAVLCMVTVISASAAIIVEWYEGRDREDPSPSGDSKDDGGDRGGQGGGPDNRDLGVEAFYSHHAVIFGSRRDVIGTFTAALGRCGRSQAAATAAAVVAGDDGASSSNSTTTSTMEIRISCEGHDAQLDINKIGDHVECRYDVGRSSSRRRSERSERYCTIPPLHVSYVSFDCMMNQRPDRALPAAEIAMTSVLATIFGCDDSSSTNSTIDATRTTTAADESAVPAIAFLHMKRFCSRDIIVTVPGQGCMGGNYTTAFGECARWTSSWKDNNDGTTDATTDCISADCSPRPLRIIDDTDCPENNPLDREPLEDDVNGDELVNILVANVSAIRDRQQQQQLGHETGGEVFGD